MASKKSRVNPKRPPVDRSVALKMISGRPDARDRRMSPVEQMLVVVFRRELAPVEVERRQTHPVAGAEELQDQVSLHRTLQEACLEVPKDAIPVQPVVGGREAPTGHGGDQVDLIEGRPRSPPQHDGGGCQLLQDAVGEGRRPGAASGERQDQRQLVRARPDGVARARAGSLRLPVSQGDVSQARRRAARLRQHDQPHQKRQHPVGDPSTTRMARPDHGSRGLGRIPGRSEEGSRDGKTGPSISTLPIESHHGDPGNRRGGQALAMRSASRAGHQPMARPACFLTPTY